MLRSVNDLRGLAIGATDDTIGSVDDFFFDDERWTLRYMVVNTGNWLLQKPVLISPRSIRDVDWDNRQVAVALTRQQVQDAPGTTTDQPVSRQMEIAHARYYRYDPYWYGSGLWGGVGFPYSSGGVVGYEPLPLAAMEPEPERSPSVGDSHLRSTHEVVGYHIRAADGEIGHIADIIMDDATWAVRYLVIDTRNWWPGKKVLVAPSWIIAVNWNDRTVDVDLSREAIKGVPEYDPSVLNREYEERLYTHYDRPRYWEEDATHR
ncbi:PRC-barrel domain containing protein [Chloroflexales bacterium ZM16-3]|nr:PRC-barrel domain containing protein [Chloroflexales bacterium ZM16-3]